MDFPTIHTNFWDAVLGVPMVLIITQIIKVSLKPRKIWVPNIAVGIGLMISVFISHPGHLIEGIFMGLFYGSAAVGAYASLKTTIQYIKQKYNLV